MSSYTCDECGNPSDSGGPICWTCINELAIENADDPSIAFHITIEKLVSHYTPLVGKEDLGMQLGEFAKELLDEGL